MLLSLVLLSLFTPSPSLAAGEAFLARLSAAGFACLPLQGQGGSICTTARSAAIPYSKPIAILVPAGLEQPASAVLYLHGDTGVCESDGATALNFATTHQLLKGLIAGGGGRTILVLPLSENRNVTFVNELLPRFDSFALWIGRLAPSAAGKWVVAGHSRAGGTLSRLLGNNPAFARTVAKAVLLDATYSMGAFLPFWKKAVVNQRGLRIVSRAVPGESPYYGAKTLAAELGANVKAENSLAGGHCAVPRLDFAAGLAH